MGMRKPKRIGKAKILKMLKVQPLAQTLTAHVLFRPVGSDRAIIKISQTVFTVESVSALARGSVAVNARDCKTTLDSVKSEQDLQKLFAKYPKLKKEDLAS